MLIIKIIRFLMGYVSFSASGGFSERFVNLCTMRRIPLWNMKKTGGVLYASTSVDGYKNIRQCAHRSGVKLKLESKHGLPFLLNRNRRRKGVVIGLVLSLVTVFFLSSMIWSVSVQGNNNLSEAEILSAFEQLGVKRGAFARRIDASAAADEAVKLLPELLWASVNIRGSLAEIVVCERTDAPEFPDTATPCNIVAGEDGVIASVQVNIGTEAVSPGDAVLKGDLLISGVTDNLDSTETLKSARGNVIASVKRSINADYGGEPFLTQTGEKTRYTLYFLGIKIPLGLSVGEENYSKSESCLTDGNVVLPVGIITEHSFSAADEAALPPEYVPLYNADRYAKEYYETVCEGEISDYSFTVNQSAFYAEMTVLKDIGVRQEIFVEN